MWAIILTSFKHPGEFDDVLDSSSSLEPLEKIHLTYCNLKNPTLLKSSVPLDKCEKLLDIENLTLETPTSNATLVRDLSLEIYETDHLLVMILFISIIFTFSAKLASKYRVSF